MKVFLWIWRGIWPFIGLAALGYWGGKSLGEISGGMSVAATILLGAVCAVVGLIVGFTGWAEEVPPRWFWTMSEVDLLDNRIGRALQYAGQFFWIPAGICGINTFLHMTFLFN
ncbi:MAG: hypothetical protein IJM74_02320 [Bacteroidales bacterium]|nr:hypothetical protein [Bacteroidales bacterium]